MNTRPDITTGQERPDPEMLLAELAGFTGDLDGSRKDWIAVRDVDARLLEIIAAGTQ